MRKSKRIGFFLKWRLRRKGRIDGKNEVYRPSNIEGKYHTPYIDIYMTEFIRIANGKFTDIIEQNLKELNQSITNLKQRRDVVISNARSETGALIHEIDDIKKKKNLTSHDKAIIGAKENRITEIRTKARKEINDTNKQGIANLGEANEVVKNFNADFSGELSFCREKLTIYWDSLFSKCKKKNPDTDINGQLPTEEDLVIMYNIKNPSSGFKIESYDIVSLEDFEDNNE